MNTVRIDPAKVPDCDFELGCRTLYSCITRALADPRLRQEYEDWKERYHAEKARQISNERK